MKLLKILGVGRAENKGQAYEITYEITADEAELVPPRCCYLKS